MHGVRSGARNQLAVAPEPTLAGQNINNIVPPEPGNGGLIAETPATLIYVLEIMHMVDLRFVDLNPQLFNPLVRLR
jgi:hypothetical protein